MAREVFIIHLNNLALNGISPKIQPRSILAEVFRMEIDEEGIIAIFLANPEQDHIHATKALIDELVDGMENLAGGIPRPMLFHFDETYVAVDKEVRTYITRHPRLNAVKKAEAIVTVSLASILIANAYLSISKPPRPARLFKDAGKAREWLRRFL